MLPIIRSAQSEEDLVAIWCYIAKDNPTAATRLLERLDRRIRTLARYPLLGEHQQQFGEDTRRITEGNYLVFYDVLPDAIHILRVFHGARKVDELFP